ncbi:MAG TPA: EAL domain-containing protein [Acidimicrobiales bacterium]|nr:EAL domain-containing protein [Acidimicrobiales bacterium]
MLLAGFSGGMEADLSAQLSPRTDVGVIFGALWVGVGGAAVVALALTQSGSFADVPLDVPAYWLAPAFALCEVLAIRVVRRQAQFYGFALSEVPLVIGLVYAAPASLVATRMVAVAAVLLVMRRRPVEVAFELGLTAVQTVVAVAVFAVTLGDASPIGWRGVAAVLAGLVASHLVAVGAVVFVVVAGGWPGRQSIRQMVTSGSWAAVLDAAIGVGVALLVWRVPHLGVLVAAVVVACVWSNRLYTRLAERHRRLEILHAFAGSVVRSVDLADIAASVLRGSRNLFQADDAALLLAPIPGTDEASRIVCSGDTIETFAVSPDDFTAELDALVPERAARAFVPDAVGTPEWLAALRSGRALAAPLTNAGGDVSGALVVSQAEHRSSFGFGDDQAELLGELATHASMALENGVLFLRLQRDADIRAHQLLHDSLTDLPNRVQLNQLLEAAVEGIDGVRNRIGLLVIDLDEFSQVSDAFGHESTDELLKQACKRIRGLLPDSATLCRIGPNEFGAILRDLDTVDEAEAAARLLIAGFDPPFQVEGVLLALGVNIGVAVYPVHAVDVPSLVQRTHIARDTARRLRSGWELYDPVYDPATPRRLALGAELREALEGSELDVCFQPKVEVTTGIVRGAEALVRWNHPRLGRVRPAEFIAVAEHTGDIRNLTMVVMRRSLTECRSWRDRGLDMSVAVNLSARNLLDLNLVDDVASLLESVGVPAEALTLELTESMVMSESQRSVTVLEGLDDLGVCLSCDDFGTGYSSLAHLRRLPIGEIKIDKSFIARMTHEESDRAIARSVLALGRDLGLTTVAEGVESSAGLEMLATLGCDLAQGFYVCPPLAVPQFEQWLAQREALEIPA